jgi:hypothetical protein
MKVQSKEQKKMKKMAIQFVAADPKEKVFS